MILSSHPNFTHDESYFFFLATEGQRNVMIRRELSSGRLEKLAPPLSQIIDYRPCPFDKNLILLVGKNPGHPPELGLWNSSQETLQLLHLPPDQLSHLGTWVSSEQVSLSLQNLKNGALQVVLYNINTQKIDREFGPGIVYDSALAEHFLYAQQSDNGYALHLGHLNQPVKALTPPLSSLSSPQLTVKGLQYLTNEGSEFEGLYQHPLGPPEGTTEPVVVSEWEIEAAACSKDLSSFSYTLNVHGESQIWFQKAGESPKSIPRLPTGIFGQLKQSPSGRFIAFTGNHAESGSEVFLFDTHKEELVKTTEPNPADIFEPQPSDSPFVIDLGIKGGVTRNAWIFPAYRDSVKWAIFLHGGPRTQVRPRQHKEFQLLREAGYSIAALNFRGSTGYGKTGLEAPRIQGRETLLEDLEDLLHILEGQYDLDSSQAGLVSESYSSYFTPFLCQQLKFNWKFVATFSGFYDLETHIAGLSGARKADRMREYRDLLSSPAVLQKFEEHHQIDAPLFVAHMQSDPFTNAQQSAEFFQPQSHKKNQFCCPPGRGHGLTALLHDGTIKTEFQKFLQDLEKKETDGQS